MAKIVSLALLLQLGITSRADSVCPDEWKEFSTSCYILMHKYRNTSEFDWLKASNVCRGFGGNLASIGSEKEMELVTNFSSQQKTDHAWIGLVYWFQEGGYLWSDGTPFNSSVYADWLNDKPCNHSGIGCVQLSRNGSDLTSCNYKEKQEFICEKPKGPLPCPTADWFLNGLTCYKASDKWKTWFDARRDCYVSGGDLLKTDDKEERDFLAFYLDLTGLKNATTHVWIGDKTSRACVTMSTDDGLKHEVENCEQKMLYICEKQASVSKSPKEEGDESSINAVAYISAGVALLLLLIVSIMISIWRYSKSHRKKIERTARSQRQIVPLDKWEILPEQIEYEEELGRGAFGVVHKATLRRRAGIEVFETGKRLRKEPKRASKMVAVKVLQDDATEAQKEQFMSEIEQMKMLGFHQNIVSLVGCCTLQEHMFLVIEYVAFGDLLQWLRRRRRMINMPKVSQEKCYEDKDVVKDGRATTDFDKKEGDQIPVEMGSIVVDMALSSQDRPEESNAIQIKIVGDQPVVDETSLKGHDCEDPLDQELLSVPSTSNGNSPAAAFSTENLEDSDDEEEKSFSAKQLFCFAWQIAKGMNHLAEINFVHRDLAARNVLVGCDNKVKVSDFGLMRQIYEDVNTSENTRKLPVKWMAPEALYQNICTTKSDVWAFGILLWEMATLGGVPYPTLTNSELYHLLNTGYRMERPDMCCEEVYEMMTECWEEDPCNRPSFFQLIEKLETIMQMDVPYLDVSKHDEASPYYNVPSGASTADDRV